MLVSILRDKSGDVNLPIIPRVIIQLERKVLIFWFCYIDDEIVEYLTPNFISPPLFGING